MKNINRLITVSTIMVLFVCSCENTITDNSTGDTPLVGGCTDPIANNYNADAEADDGSCAYGNIDYGVIINEINYNSLDDDSANPEDWVELYNTANETIAIGLWEFRDEGNVFTIPENTVLLSGHYLVLCENLDMFSDVFPSVSVLDIVGDFGFGLNGSGELVRLLDSSGLLVDEVEYDDIAPWPTEPDGTGPTLELIDPSLDNALGENWATSNNDGGTPGEINSVIHE